MRIRTNRLNYCILILVCVVGTACVNDPLVTTPTTPRERTSNLVRIPLVVTPKLQRAVEPGSQIVITDIEGECREEVQDALMQRLIDKVDYDVLTRRYLKQILLENRQVVEGAKTWEGDFNEDTGAKIGELLRASQHIVGRIVYCGPTFRTEGEKLSSGDITIIALLQILDLTTGKVILSTAAEGRYSPNSNSTMMLQSVDPEEMVKLKKSLEQVSEVPDAPDGSEVEDASEASQSSFSVAKLVERLRYKASEARADLQEEVENFPRLRAAENLADSFANKFFARPTWEEVKMWSNFYWHYGDSIRYVKLGQCPTAVSLLESVGAQELRSMPDREVGEYLHNFGVALLCSNRPEEALKKLRAAYRLNYKQSTLDMISFGSKVLEWHLEVEVDTEPEMQILMERIGS